MGRTGERDGVLRVRRAGEAGSDGAGNRVPPQRGDPRARQFPPPRPVLRRVGVRKPKPSCPGRDLLEPSMRPGITAATTGGSNVGDRLSTRVSRRNLTGTCTDRIIAGDGRDTSKPGPA